MGKTKKKIFLVLIITFLLVNIFNVVFASVKEINPDSYNPDSITGEDARLVFAKTSMILGAIRNISVVVSVIALMVIGLKYIFGSVEEKANYKQTMMPYIIGCIMAVAGTTIVSFIYNAFN